MATIEHLPNENEPKPSLSSLAIEIPRASKVSFDTSTGTPVALNDVVDDDDSSGNDDEDNNNSELTRIGHAPNSPSSPPQQQPAQSNKARQPKPFGNLDGTVSKMLDTARRSQPCVVFDARQGFVRGSRVLHKTVVAIVRYRGTVKSNANEIWVGLELQLPVGQSDGVFHNQRHFTCAPHCAVFVPELQAGKPFIPKYGFATVEGYLRKQGGRIKTWKLRWCALVKDHLHYYENPEDKNPKGIVHVPSYEIVDSSKLDPAHRPVCSFALVCKSNPKARTYYFQCMIESQKQQWMESWVS